jgi:hypothetical protein
MAKRRTAEQASDTTPENPSTSPTALASERQPGDEPRQNWQQRASIIVDEAGVRFHFDYKNHQAIIAFDEKPAPELLERLRPVLNEGNFEWDRQNQDGWKVKIRFPHREDDRREAKKTFYEVANVLREAKGLPTKSFGQDIPI